MRTSAQFSGLVCCLSFLPMALFHRRELDRVKLAADIAKSWRRPTEIANFIVDNWFFINYFPYLRVVRKQYTMIGILSLLFAVMLYNQIPDGCLLLLAVTSYPSLWIAYKAHIPRKIYEELVERHSDSDEVKVGSAAFVYLAHAFPRNSLFHHLFTTILEDRPAYEIAYSLNRIT